MNCQYRIGGLQVVEPVAGQRAVSAKDSCAVVCDLSVGAGRHVLGIEVDQVLVEGDAVRIMAGGAGGLLVHNVIPVAAILTETVERAETLVAQDAVAVVALVAEGVIDGTLTHEIDCD